MKLMHLSDLHLGKRVNGFSMVEDQRFILREILEIAEQERPEGFLLCGDIYDKTVPSAEAVELFDDFLSKLAALGCVYIISGNHDSAERLAFGGRLFAASKVYVSPVYDGTVTTVVQGEVCIHLLPFLKPAQVRPHFPDAVIENYTDAIRAALSVVDLHDGRKHVLLTHQLVTGSERCESEELSIGGTDNVDAAVFEGFDYVALGHLHGPQRAGGDHIRYCGTPLKYSFSEADHKKSVTIVELGETVEVSTHPLHPKRDLRVLRGTYSALMARSYYEGRDLGETYLHITLTDEEEIPQALSRLRSVYPYLMKLSYDNTRTRQHQNPMEAQFRAEDSPLDLFRLLYEKQNNQPLSEEQATCLRALMETIWEVEP